MRTNWFRLSLVALIVIALAPVLASAPVPVAAQGTCGTAPAPRLSPGAMARVTVISGTGNNLRSAPTTADPNNVAGVMPEGEVFTVLQGPNCAENFWWYEIRRWDGTTGWTAEGVTGEYWIEPWPIPDAKLSSGPPPANENGEIAFLSGDAMGMAPVVIAVDGNTRRDLGGQLVQDNVLVWAPDSPYVAYSDGNDIWMAGRMDILNVTNGVGPNYMPTFSPDGQNIAYASQRDGNAEIYVTNLTNMQTTRLTNDPGNDLFPAWSPDGQRIAFTSDRSGTMELYIMASNGANPAPVTSGTPSNKTDPAWSPNGQYLAYIATTQTGSALFVAQPGTAPVQLTEFSAAQYPAWAPDSSRVAFVNEGLSGSGEQEVFSIRTDGSDLMQYTANGTQASGVSWSADGNWLAYSKGAPGTRDIFTIRANGIGVHNLTRSPGVDDTFPVFQPALEAGAPPPDPGQPATAQPGTAPPPSNPAAQDLQLIYDPNVPVFTLKNVSGGYLDLRPLSFQGSGITVSSSIWTNYTSSPLESFMPGGCLMIWRFGIPDQSPPPECGGARQGYVMDQVSLFWASTDFTVLYNGAPVTTCPIGPATCTVDLP